MLSVNNIFLLNGYAMYRRVMETKNSLLAQIIKYLIFLNYF